MATVLELQAKAAQGEDTSAKLAAEQKKLDNNIALDKAAAGGASTALTFTGTAGSGAASGKHIPLSFFSFFQVVSGGFRRYLLR